MRSRLSMAGGAGAAAPVGDTLHQRWTFPATALPDDWAPDALIALRDDRASIGARLGDTDPRALLPRQIAY